MSHDESAGPQPLGIDPVASRRIFLGMLALIAGAVLAYAWFRPPVGAPPAAIAHDPLLAAGHAIYQSRCAACHGPSGRGDGPIARDLPGPPPLHRLNLSDVAWDHGDRPEQVLAVIAQGVPDTAMQAWGSVLDARELRAVTAYVFYLAGRTVPGELRAR